LSIWDLLDDMSLMNKYQN